MFVLCSHAAARPVKASEAQAPVARPSLSNTRVGRVQQQQKAQDVSTCSTLGHSARPSTKQQAEMNRRNFGLSLTNLAACPVCAAVANGGGAAVASQGRYDYKQGTAGWRDVAPTCNVGMTQSPIDVPLRKLVREQKQGQYTEQEGGSPVNPKSNGVVRRSALSGRQRVVECNYKTDAEGVNVENNGFTFQVNVPGGSTATLGGDEHELLQYHFHTPSEHSFDGQYTAMEIHLVHKHKEKGSFAVVGVLLEGHEGAAPLSALDIAIRGASASAGSKTTIPTPVNLQAALSVLTPESEEVGAIVNFPGSLTTPPCSEGINWFLSTEIVGMPYTQIDSFENYRDTTGRIVRLGNNARPVQPLSNRKLTLL